MEDQPIRALLLSYARQQRSMQMLQSAGWFHLASHHTRDTAKRTPAPVHALSPSSLTPRKEGRATAVIKTASPHPFCESRALCGISVPLLPLSKEPRAHTAGNDSSSAQNHSGGSTEECEPSSHPLAQSRSEAASSSSTSSIIAESTTPRASCSDQYTQHNEESSVSSSSPRTSPRSDVSPMVNHSSATLLTRTGSRTRPDWGLSVTPSKSYVSKQIVPFNRKTHASPTIASKEGAIRARFGSLACVRLSSEDEEDESVQLGTLESQEKSFSGLRVLQRQRTCVEARLHPWQSITSPRVGPLSCQLDGRPALPYLPPSPVIRKSVTSLVDEILARKQNSDETDDDRSQTATNQGFIPPARKATISSQQARSLSIATVSPRPFMAMPAASRESAKVTSAPSRRFLRRFDVSGRPTKDIASAEIPCSIRIPSETSPSARLRFDG